MRLHHGSCVRLRPAHRDHVWSYDFVHHRTDYGRAFRIPNILDEYTRECLLIRVRRKLASWNVLKAVLELFLRRSVPGFVRSDNPPEFVSRHVPCWIATVGAKTAYIEPGSPSERTVTSRASTHGSGTSCSTGRSSRHCGSSRI